MKAISITIILFLVQTSFVLADQEGPQTTKITASSQGNHFFKMVAQKKHFDGKKFVIDREAYGVCYKVNKEGDLKEVWKTKGWYSSEVFLSNDGKYLVRMGPWNRGHKPNANDLAVAFYKDGVQIKKYATTELVKNLKSIVHWVSHYSWLARAKSDELKSNQLKETKLRLDYKGIFHLMTTDKIKYQFLVKTGEIKSQNKLKATSDYHR